MAAHPEKEAVERRFAEARDKSALLTGLEVDIVRMTLPARHGTQWTAQVGRGDRKSADNLCWKLRAAGVGCVVLHN